MFLAGHKIRLKAGVVPLLPAPVLSQAWAPGGQHAMLHKVVKGCLVMPFTDDHARGVAALCRGAGLTDVVGGFVALTAIMHDHATVITSDVDDIRRLVTAVPSRSRVVVCRP